MSQVGQKYKAVIRENATGVERSYDMGEILWADGGSIFWWGRGLGNYGCDCNRELCFRRAAGEEPELESTTCSHEKYTVVRFEFADGTSIPGDDEPSTG